MYLFDTNPDPTKVLAAFACIASFVLCDTITSGIVHSTIHDHRHLFTSRSPASVMWSAEMANDFVVLEYDRTNSAILGYQRSTGRIFAQRKPGGVVASAKLGISNAIIVGLHIEEAGVIQNRLHGASNSQQCSVLSLTSHIEATDTAWKTLGPVDETTHAQSWNVHSNTQSGSRQVSITSNRDSLLGCECTWSDTRTIWRAVHGIARSLGCLPAQSAVGHGAPLHEHDVTLLPHLQRKRARFCRDLSATLAFRVLVVVDAHSMSNQDPKTQSLSYQSNCWLRAIGERSRISASSAAGIDTIRKPRASVLTDIKYAMKSLDIVQSMLSILTKNSQVITNYAFDAIVHRWKQNFTHNLYPSSVDPHTIKQEFLELTAETGSLKTHIPTACEGSVYEDLYNMLESHNVAFTPESANTTRVGTQFGMFVSEISTCIAQQVSILSQYLRCLGHVYTVGGSSANSHDTNEFRFFAATPSIPLSDSVLHLRNSLSDKYKERALSARQHMQDISDKVVDNGLAVIDSLMSNTRVLAKDFNHALTSYETLSLAYTKPRNLPRNTSDTHWFDVMSDTWCCANEKPLPFANTTRSCIPYLERFVRRIQN